MAKMETMDKMDEWITNLQNKVDDHWLDRLNYVWTASILIFIGVAVATK